MTKEKITLSLEVEQIKALKTISEESGNDMSSLICDMIRFYNVAFMTGRLSGAKHMIVKLGNEKFK